MSCFARSAGLNGFQGRLSARAHAPVCVHVKAGAVEGRGERSYMCIMYVYANACVRLSPFVPVRLKFPLSASQFLSVGSVAPPAPQQAVCIMW